MRMTAIEFKAKIGKPRTNSSNTGKPFEREIEVACLAYKKRKVALIEKVDPPNKLVGKQVIHLKNPFLDYVGAVKTPTGVRPILFEAKSTKTNRLALCPLSKTYKESKHGLTLTQWETMNRWSNAGAIVFLLWKFGESILRVSLNDLHFQVARSDTKSMQFGECGEMVGCDFLQGII